MRVHLALLQVSLDAVVYLHLLHLHLHLHHRSFCS
jgi:hypothetical protein